MKLETHLCIVIDRVSGATLAEYTVEAEDWYYARHRATDRFRKEHPDRAKCHDWCVDSLQLPAP